jgi:hypothetical protein
VQNLDRVAARRVHHCPKEEPAHGLRERGARSGVGSRNETVLGDGLGSSCVLSRWQNCGLRTRSSRSVLNP